MRSNVKGPSGSCEFQGHRVFARTRGIRGTGVLASWEESGSWGLSRLLGFSEGQI